MKTVLVVDANNLAWKSFHTIRGLSAGGVKTNVVYGLLRQVEAMTRSHAASAVVFCFDAKDGKDGRRKIFPGYKRREDKFTEEQKAARKVMRKELRLLEKDYLPAAGYANVFSAPGFEADDVVASVCRTLPDGWRAVIASSDEDLYQLMTDRVWVWNGKRMTTPERLKEEVGVWPSDWPSVKALGGCVSDTVPGCKGVGPATAVKYLQRHDSVGPKTAAKIKAFFNAPDKPFQTFLSIVRLPFPGCPKFTFQPGMPDLRKFDKLVRRLGIKSLRGPG